MADYQPDYRGLGEFLGGAEMQAAMLDCAEKVKARFEATAPRETGEYATSAVVSLERRGGVRKDRAAGVVTLMDPDGFYKEMGTKDTPAHHSLRNALHSVRL